jgi:hypothetical protein
VKTIVPVWSLIYFADKAILAAAATKDVVRGADTT